jgi:hypothetical protein
MREELLWEEALEQILFVFWAEQLLLGEAVAVYQAQTIGI